MEIFGHYFQPEEWEVMKTFILLAIILIVFLVLKLVDDRIARCGDDEDA